MRITDLEYGNFFRFRGKDLIYLFSYWHKSFDGTIRFCYFFKVNGKVKEYKSTGNKFIELVEKNERK